MTDTAHAKPFWQSKTVWFNVLTGLTLFFALPELQAVLPEGAVQYALLAQAAINIVLRVAFTVQPTTTAIR